MTLARSTWRAAEPLHAMVYFSAEPQEEYGALGYDVQGNRAAGYFPARAAAMGAVSAAVVTAVFYNFSPLAVAFGMDRAWEVATPEQVQQARWRGAERALRRLLGDAADGPQVRELAGLVREACAAAPTDGRPLYAANAGLPWPEEPLLQVFHGQTLLREFRGDGHVTALLHAGVDGLGAAVQHVAQGDAWTRRPLQATRAWSDEQWDAAVARFVERGEMTPDGAFTDLGRARRQAVEDETDRLAAAPYEALGEQGCARLRELAAPLSKAVVAAGGIGVR